MTLVEHQNSGPYSIRELAEENDIPRRFLEQIMLELKSQGWVESIPGRDGGYQMKIAADKLTMGQVVRYFDGILAPIACVSTSHYEPCSQEPRCRFRQVLLEIRNYVSQAMDKATLAKVVRGAIVAKEEVFSQEFAFADGI
ncbi:MAG: Rrf2 family transcriptional regulator [Planctomycetales bacterium]